MKNAHRVTRYTCGDIGKQDFFSSQLYYLAPAHKAIANKMGEKAEGTSTASPKTEESSVPGILPASHWQKTKVCTVYRLSSEMNSAMLVEGEV